MSTCKILIIICRIGKQWKMMENKFGFSQILQTHHDGIALSVPHLASDTWIKFNMTFNVHSAITTPQEKVD